MIGDITNEVLTKVKNSLTNVSVYTYYPNSTPTFPCVIVSDGIRDKIDTVDSSGVYHVLYNIQFDIFTDGDLRTSDARSIRDTIYTCIETNFNLNLDFSDTMPNYSDNGVYRYIMRYTGTIDKNDLIYRR